MVSPTKHLITGATMPRLENLPRNQLSFRRSANNLHIATGEDLDLEQARAILKMSDLAK